MKGIIKKILTLIGLHQFLRQILTQIHQKNKKKLLSPYQNESRWTLQIEDVKVHYDVEDPYSKSWFFPRYANGKIHEPAVTRFFIDHIENDSIVLDIGGHLGYFTCLAGILAKNGQVHVFETAPNCIPLIEKNILLNHLDNIVIVHAAVSNTNESVRILAREEPDPGLMIKSKEDGPSMKIKGIKLDDYIHDHHIIPDLIKIDVEGAEWQVLSGMTETLKQKNLKLLVEVHPEKLLKHFYTDYGIIIDFLLRYGFQIEALDHHSISGHSRTIEADCILKGNVMLFCTK